MLVVEDEPMVRKLACRILRRAGYDVMQASDGAEALRLIGQPQLTIDLLFTDVVMPQMNGHTLAMRALELRPGLPIVFSSGYPADTVGRRIDLPAEIRLVLKPYSASSLTDAIASGLHVEE